MAINHFKLISEEELKSSEFWDESKVNKEYLKTNLINEAISISTEIIDYLSGGQIEPDFNNGKINDTNLNYLKQACERFTNFLLRNGVEYMRATSQSIHLGQVNFQTSNPADQMYLPPEVVMLIKKAGYFPDSVQISLFKDLGNPLEQDLKPKTINDFLDPETKRELDIRYLTEQEGIYSRDGSIIIKHENRANGYQLNIQLKRLMRLNSGDFIPNSRDKFALTNVDLSKPFYFLITEGDNNKFDVTGNLNRVFLDESSIGQNFWGPIIIPSSNWNYLFGTAKKEPIVNKDGILLNSFAAGNTWGDIKDYENPGDFLIYVYQEVNY